MKGSGTAEQRAPGAAEQLRAGLTDARQVELELLEGVPDAQLLGVQAHFLEPPIWEMGHVGWFQEYWLLRRVDGSDALLPGADGIYDSFHVSYKLRWEHAYPSRAETQAYISEVLTRSLGRLEAREPTAEEVYFYTLATLHEDMHTENLTLILQTLGYDRPRVSLYEPARAAPPVDPDYRPRDVRVPGGAFLLGAPQDEPFVFDNEKWAHPVQVAPFAIASVPVTNGQF
ncbi:MAG: DinB family protein, partial [Candidatus Methylomirabilales bacterium]